MNASLSAKHYFWLDNLVVLGLVVWSGVSLGLSIYGHRLENSLRSQRQVKQGRNNTPRPRSLAQYEAIANHNIFGGTGETAENPSTEAPIRIGGDNLRLKGTILDEQSGYFAIVLEDIKTKRQDLYRPGDRIGSTEILQIARDSVTVNQNGKEVRLQIHMEDIKERSRTSRKKTTTKKTTASNDKGGPIARSVGENSFVVSRAALGQNMTDLSSFVGDARIVPFFKDGQPYGFQVRAVKPDSLFHQLGLRRGDIITSVNDVSVARPEDLINLYRQMQQLDAVSVNIDRKGRQQTFNYAFR